MTAHSEFSVENARQYNHRSALRWIFSHLWESKGFLLLVILFSIGQQAMFSQAQILIGTAADAIVKPGAVDDLLTISLLILAMFLGAGFSDLTRSLSLSVIAERLEASTRKELYISLLGKSQTFHDQQRVGNLMAMATDDVQQMNQMINPGILFISDIVLGFAIPVIVIATINLQLLLVPILFIVAYFVSVRFYSRRLNPVAYKQRNQFSKLNSVAEETISGIEIVKASARENFERRKFYRNAKLFRGYFVKQGYIEARYLPLLIYAVALGAAFLHAVVLYQNHVIDIGGLIAFVGIFNMMRWPTFASIFAWTLIQLGFASAQRVLGIILAESDIDENLSGHTAAVKGDITFDNVAFGYEDGVVLQDINFHIEPGQTVAIVGGTGSGKSTLTELINRTYDATEGRILIDGVDVRDWNLTSLRSQISKIEQDVFLFSRTLAENIAFGAPSATQAQIEQAAKEAQAHEFIMSFADGYQTIVGERGFTLSGGQRQRIALARAFLSNPRILILDDSTSAIDSATEDEIQKAIRRAQQGRTTLLITHRLSQIRWADHILVLERGRLVANGTHEELLRRSPHYRRIFARYEIELPPLETEEPQTA
ncbi:MAG TPA: ABC transporter ATP-binding protein [Phototrophicaceae bacterium]|nr:ABC transporter ATP-binding protein [Phototrophicaceae bacterium]